MVAKSFNCGNPGRGPRRGVRARPTPYPSLFADTPHNRRRAPRATAAVRQAQDHREWPPMVMRRTQQHRCRRSGAKGKLEQASPVEDRRRSAAGGRGVGRGWGTVGARGGGATAYRPAPRERSTRPPRADAAEGRLHGGRVGAGEVAAGERDHAVAHHERRGGDAELALEDGRGVAGGVRVIDGDSVPRSGHSQGQDTQTARVRRRTVSCSLTPPSRLQRTSRARRTVPRLPG